MIEFGMPMKELHRLQVLPICQKVAGETAPA